MKVNVFFGVIVAVFIGLWLWQAVKALLWWEVVISIIWAFCYVWKKVW